MSAIDILMHRRLTLLDPASWADRNDVAYIKAFAARRSLKSVLALCFTERSETFHHWRVFTEGSNGVCLEFDKQKLLSQISNQPCLKTGLVKYPALARVRKMTDKTEFLPFLKRKPYMDEREFRIIAWDETEMVSRIHLPIDLSCINRIVLSPWLGTGLAETVMRMIHSIEGCQHFQIDDTGLIDSFKWKMAAIELDL